MLRVEIIKNVSDRYNITESYRKEYGDNVVMELLQVPLAGRLWDSMGVTDDDLVLGRDHSAGQN